MREDGHRRCETGHPAIVDLLEQHQIGFVIPHHSRHDVRNSDIGVNIQQQDAVDDRARRRFLKGTDEEGGHREKVEDGEDRKSRLVFAPQSPKDEREECQVDRKVLDAKMGELVEPPEESAQPAQNRWRRHTNGPARGERPDRAQA